MLMTCVGIVWTLTEEEGERAELANRMGGGVGMTTGGGVLTGGGVPGTASVGKGVLGVANLETTKGVTLSSSSEPASIPAANEEARSMGIDASSLMVRAANEEARSMGIDASSLMVRARIRFLPSFRTLTIRSALAAAVAIAMTRRWMGAGATLILVWMGVLARIRGGSGGGIVGRS
jgi:hypothetical protein